MDCIEIIFSFTDTVFSAIAAAAAIAAAFAAFRAYKEQSKQVQILSVEHESWAQSKNFERASKGPRFVIYRPGPMSYYDIIFYIAQDKLRAMDRHVICGDPCLPELQKLAKEKKPFQIAYLLSEKKLKDHLVAVHATLEGESVGITSAIYCRATITGSLASEHGAIVLQADERFCDRLSEDPPTPVLVGLHFETKDGFVDKHVYAFPLTDDECWRVDPPDLRETRRREEAKRALGGN